MSKLSKHEEEEIEIEEAEEEEAEEEEAEEEEAKEKKKKKPKEAKKHTRIFATDKVKEEDYSKCPYCKSENIGHDPKIEVYKCFSCGKTYVYAEKED